MAFDLEEQIARWKRGLLASGNLGEGEVEEIEDHLRSIVECRVDLGDSEEEAFQAAALKVGKFESISAEYGEAKFSGRISMESLLISDLLSHYVKAAIRSLSRNKVNAFLHVSCLGIGLMCVFFISHFISYHLSVDDQFRGKGLYRVTYHVIDGDHEGTYAHGPVPLAPTMKEEIPQVSDAVRIWMSSPVLKIKDQLFYEDVMMFTDPSFFTFFNLPLIIGDAETALSRPQSVVISQQMATKFFGKEDPIGQVIEYNGYPAWETTLEVTGVFGELPENIHLDFHLAASLVGMDTERTNWGSFKPIYTYLTLREGGQTQEVENHLNNLVDKYMAYRREDADLFEYQLEPVEDIHIRSEVASAMKPAINATLLWTMGAIGLLILALSCINYINLSLAQLYHQYREVGIRKVFGASQGHIRQRFLVSGLLTLAIGIVVAGWLVVLLGERYQSLSGVQLDVGSLWRYGYLWPVLLGVLGLCLLAVYVPGIRLAGLHMQTALKARITTARSRVSSLFVLIQFVLSSMLLVGTLLMQDQIRYIFNRELGVDGNNVVAIRRPPLDQAFKDALAGNASIESFAYSQLLPMNEMSYDGRRIQKSGDPTNYSAMSCFASPTFLETYDIQLLAGRAFSESIQSDSAAFIINEQALSAYGLGSAEEALGSTLIWSGAIEGKVIGVIQDFHLRSLHEPIGPLVLLRTGDSEWYSQFLSVKVNQARREETLNFLKTTYEQYAESTPFDYFFMTDSYEQIHAEDLNFSYLAIVFSSIAIVIALMGLFGLVNIDLNKLMKEIGIRKVLGSSVQQIFTLIGAGYAKRILIAFALAIPVAVFFTQSWLDQYAYRTDIKVSTIIWAGFLISAVAAGTISWKTYRAATVNPARLLKEE